MCSKTKTIITLAIVFVAGYFVGAFVGVPNMNSNNGAGNVSMASKFHKNTVSPTMSAFQEKLMNDPVALEQAALSLSLISSRMAQFNALVDAAIDASKDVPELEGYMETLRNMKTISDNAQQNGKDAINSFDQTFLQKNSNAADYEQTSQKLTLAYLLVDRQMKVAKEYVAALDKVIGNSPDQNLKLSAVRDLWANYCAGNAYINNDEEEQSYWEKQSPLCTSEQLAGIFVQIDLPPVVVKPISWVDEVNPSFEKAVKGFGSDVKAGFDSDVKAGIGADVKAGFGADVKNFVRGELGVFSYDVVCGFGRNVLNSFGQDVKAGFNKEVKSGFSTEIRN